MNLTFSQKTTFSFAAISLLGILIAVIGTMASRNILGDSRLFTDSILPSTDALLQLDRDLHQALIAEINLDRATDKNRDSLVESANENIQQVEERWESYKESAKPLETASTRVLESNFDKHFGIWKRESEKALALLNSKDETDQEKGLAIVQGSAAEAFDLAREQINQLTETLETEVAIIKEEAEATASKALISILAAAGVCLVASIFLTWKMGYQVAQKLKIISTQLRETATQTSETSAQISDSSRRVAEGASEQAASLEETSSSLEEGAATAEKSASSALRIKEVSEETSRSAQEGASEMKTMTEAMQLIAEASNNIAHTLKTIDEIAFQTNILALNAAVEAARAGEAGAGFAVVADEVRALAQRCAEAARETSSRIDESTQRSEQGLKTSELVSKRLEQICAKAIEMDDLMSSLANSTTEQSAGISQINIAVTQMDQVTQTNAAVAEETASATVQLDKQTALMHEMVEELSGLVDGHMLPREFKVQRGPSDNRDPFDHDYSNRSGKQDTQKLDALFSN